MRVTLKSAALYFLLGFVSFAALIASGRAIGMPFAEQKYALRGNMCAPDSEEGGQIYFVSCGGID